MIFSFEFEKGNFFLFLIFQLLPEYLINSVTVVIQSQITSTRAWSYRPLKQLLGGSSRWGMFGEIGIEPMKTTIGAGALR